MPQHARPGSSTARLTKRSSVRWRPSCGNSFPATPTFGLVFVTPRLRPRRRPTCSRSSASTDRFPPSSAAAAPVLVGTGREQEDGSGFSLLLASFPGRPLPPPSPSTRRRSKRRARVLAGKNGNRRRAGEGMARPSSIHFRSTSNTGSSSGTRPTRGCPSSAGSPPACRAIRRHGSSTTTGPFRAESPSRWRATSPSTPSSRRAASPIGEPLTVTQAERNVLLRLGSRPAYEVLSDV